MAKTTKTTKLSVVDLTSDGLGYVLSDGRSVVVTESGVIIDRATGAAVTDIREIVCDGRDLADIRIIRR